MPFKSGPSKSYFMQRELPGYGPLRRISLGTTRAADAKAMENAVLELARRGLHDPRLFGILDALQGQGSGKRGAVSPAEVMVAVRSPDGPEDGLMQLLRRLDDPVLADVIAERVDDPASTREERIALPVVLAVAEARWGKGCRFSVLQTSAGVQAVLEDARTHGKTADAGGRSARPRLANTVVRYEKRAVSALLTARLGRHERDRIMADVAFAGSDDRRRLRTSVVTLESIARLCDELDAGRWQEGDEAASLYVRIAASTGAEVPAIARARTRDFRPGEHGTATLYLHDTKKAKQGVSRDRDVLLSSTVAAEVETYHDAGRSPDAALFPLAWTRFQTMFGKARKRAGLTEAVQDGQNQLAPLRPHDLRRVYALFARQAGVSRETVGLAGLGHSRLQQTDDYIRSDVQVSPAEAEAVARALGFVNPD